MIEGLVSVIVPVFNRGAALQEAVASVLRQSYAQWELWIVDDGSTDGTAEVAEQLAASDARIRCLRQANGGPGTAREAGRQAARGEFLQYLDSDDLLLPRKLDRQVQALRSSPSAGIAYCRCQETDERGHVLATPLRASDRRIERIFPTFLLSRWWNTITPLYRSELCERAGPWLPLFQEEDWELDARIGGLRPALVFVDEVLAEARHHLPVRLSSMGLPDRERLKSRALARSEILQHARRAGVESDAPEMAHFSRALFLLARQCGAVGLTAEARRLLRLARGAAAIGATRHLLMLGYGIGARLIGWRSMSVVGEYLRAFRRRNESP